MTGRSAARRFEGLPEATVGGHLVPVAQGLRARLLGLSGLDLEDAPPGLLIPRCSSVHTFGMRFALDLLFIGAGGDVLASRRAVRPRRFRACRGAAAVLELPALADQLDLL
jgi:uncharacterized membrane protein (UPF0127 family)